MDTDLGTLATALYVVVDGLLIAHPGWLPERQRVGIALKLSDAELIMLAVLYVLLGYNSERHFICDAKTRLRCWFPYIPDHSGCNKRLSRSGASSCTSSPLLRDRRSLSRWREPKQTNAKSAQRYRTGTA